MIILPAIIISLMVIAIHMTFQEDEIFEFVSRWGEKYIKSEKWQKPIFSCPKCMTFWYGVPIYFIGHWLDIEMFADIRLQTIAFVVIVAIGISTVYVTYQPEKE